MDAFPLVKRLKNIEIECTLLQFCNLYDTFFDLEILPKRLEDVQRHLSTKETSIVSVIDSSELRGKIWCSRSVSDIFYYRYWCDWSITVKTGIAMIGQYKMNRGAEQPRLSNFCVRNIQFCIFYTFMVDWSCLWKVYMVNIYFASDRLIYKFSKIASLHCASRSVNKRSNR